MKRFLLVEGSFRSKEIDLKVCAEAEAEGLRQLGHPLRLDGRLTSAEQQLTQPVGRTCREHPLAGGETSP